MARVVRSNSRARSLMVYVIEVEAMGMCIGDSAAAGTCLQWPDYI
jgi:hypothetical protein